VRLVYAESFDTLSAALKREYELKQWPRWKKQALVASARRPRAAGKMDFASDE
jgi:predicted GIY-YIG superfamily endonuclease